MSAVLEEVAWEAGVSVEEICGTRGRPIVQEARAAAAWLGWQICREHPTIVAEAIGRTTRVLTYKLTNNADRLRRDCPDFRAMTDRLAVSIEAIAV